jgi:DNA-binding NarL/FixJ family response regulator
MPKGPHRRRTRPRIVACLLSANPIALPELLRLAERVGERVSLKTRHLKLTTGALEHHDVRVPNATTYVLDGFSTGLHTESVIADLRARHPSARVIVILPRLEPGNHFSLLQLGVKGLVAYPTAIRFLPRAIIAVSGGGVWMPRTLISNFLDRMLRSRTQGRDAATQQRLSQREREVLDCILKNQSNKEISSTLHISESTVKFHMSQLFQKFGVRRRADLILRSLQQSPT